MREVVVDCSGIRSPDEFWQRYLDAAQPEDAAFFGRNLDAFWDAIGGGLGWPGDVTLVLLHSNKLSTLRTMNQSGSFLDALKEIAKEATQINVKFIED
ncbi:barstar family protein [Pararhizobium sp. O133]|uniref:barstar family protein n=1 Tax=Pararhizobium sp. O133 TaxID=3449278 RepID=UPI003F688741